MTTVQAIDALMAHLPAPLVMVDVGARWGAPKQWESLAAHAKLFCFDPDPEEVARLNAEAPSHVRYIAEALGTTDRSAATLYVTEQPACSSVYPPIACLYEQYPALAEIRPVRTETLSLRSLDAVMRDRGITGIDAIKLDTQGSELDVLRGGRDVLGSCALIDIEVEFNPIYEGQNLFCDVDRFLRDEGFALWRISEIAHYALSEDKFNPPQQLMMAFSPPQEINHHAVRGGQVFWAQAQYVRAIYPRTGTGQLPREGAVRAAIVVANAGFWDLALEILSKADIALADEVRQLL